MSPFFLLPILMSLSLEFKRRIELIQDFDFPVSSQRLRLTPDGRYIGAIGILSLIIVI